MAFRFTALAVHSQPEALGELVELLSGPELVVETARSATEARHKIASKRYAIILCAHRPDDLDGISIFHDMIVG